MIYLSPYLIKCVHFGFKSHPMLSMNSQRGLGEEGGQWGGHAMFWHTGMIEKDMGD